jgi:hypothetical protein
MLGHVTRAVAHLSLRSGLDQACGGVVRRRKLLPIHLSRLSKFLRIEASMASRARANSYDRVVKAVGTGNNHY